MYVVGMDSASSTKQPQKVQLTYTSGKGVATIEATEATASVKNIEALKRKLQKIEIPNRAVRNSNRTVTSNIAVMCVSGNTLIQTDALGSAGWGQH